MNLSVEQVRALDLSRPIFLSAGAGSGKTGVLVQRYLWALEQSGFDLGAVVAVTFTNKAAAELLARIRREVNLRITQAEPAAARGFWRAVREHLPEAWISTIHGFCARLLTAIGPAGGVGFAQRIVSGVSEAEIAEEAARTVIDEVAAAAADGDHAGLRRLLGVVTRRELIAWLASLVKVRERSERWATAVLANDDGPQAVADIAARWVAERAPARTPDPQETTKKRTKKAAAPRELKVTTAELVAQRDLARLVVRVLGAYRRELLAGGRADFHALLEHVRDALRSDAERRRFARQFQHVLVDEFQDTDPLQWEILRALFGGERVSRPGLCVVGDEKQAIFSFRDGDVATFRRAAGELDLPGTGASARARLLPPGADPGTDDAGLGVLSLRDNYRSTPGLVSFHNLLSASLFAADPTDPFEARFQEARARRAEETLVESRIEVLTADESKSGPSGREVEMAWLAARIQAFVGSGTPIHRREGDHGGAGIAPARFHDQAILLRTRTCLGEVEAALRRAAIPYQVIGGVGFYGCHEVRALVNLVTFLVDERDDLAFLGVARSGLIGLADSVLMKAVDHAGGDPGRRTLWTRVAGFADAVAAGVVHTLTPDDEPLLVAGVARLRRWRSLADRLPPNELLSLAVRESDLLFVVEGNDPSGRAAANVAKLLRVVRNMQQGGDVSLASIGRALARAHDDDEEAQADPPAQGRDAVSILTVHAAKGREWPIVFVPDGGAALRLQSDRQAEPARIHRDRPDEPPILPFAACESEDDGVQVLSKVLKERRTQEFLAEQKRLLYVAVTRARDHLILTGAIPGNAKKLPAECWAQWTRHALGEKPPSRFAEGRRGSAVLVIHPDQIEVDSAATGNVDPLLPFDRLPPAIDDAASRALVAPARTIEVAIPATSLRVLAECARRFYLDSLVGLAVANVDREVIPAAGDDGALPADQSNPAAVPSLTGRTRGLIVHAAFEALAAGVNPRDRVAAAAASFGVTDEPSRAALRAHVGRALENFQAWPIGAQVLAAAPTGVETEVGFTYGRGNAKVHGAIDLLFTAGLESVVIDYKTEAPKSEARARALAREAGYGQQLAAYAAAIARARGGVVSAWLFFTGSGIALPVVGPRGERDAAGAADDLDATLARLDGGALADFPLTDDPARCRTCPHLRSGACAGARGPENGG